MRFGALFVCFEISRGSCPVHVRSDIQIDGSPYNLYLAWLFPACLSCPCMFSPPNAAPSAVRLQILSENPQKGVAMPFEGDKNKAASKVETITATARGYYDSENAFNLCKQVRTSRTWNDVLELSISSRKSWLTLTTSGLLDSSPWSLQTSKRKRSAVTTASKSRVQMPPILG